MLRSPYRGSNKIYEVVSFYDSPGKILQFATENTFVLGQVAFLIGKWKMRLSDLVPLVSYILF